MSDRPTHMHRRTGAVVFPDGYAAAELEPLPKGHWEAVERAERIAAIKAEAARRIEAVAPTWRQMNAMRQPDEPTSIALFEQIDEIRRWSNQQEDNA